MKREDFENLADGYASLAHPKPLRILQIIQQYHPNALTPTEVAKILSLSINEVSRFLLRMERSGLITKQKSGKYSFYYLNQLGLKKLKGFL